MALPHVRTPSFGRISFSCRPSHGTLRPSLYCVPVALMGSSGAGKTTLLNVLSGRITKNVGGRVEFNGRALPPQVSKALSCFVQQDVMFFGALTVQEHLTFQVRGQAALCACVPRIVSLPSSRNESVGEDLWVYASASACPHVSVFMSESALGCLSFSFSFSVPPVNLLVWFLVRGGGQRETIIANSPPRLPSVQVLFRSSLCP